MNNVVDGTGGGGRLPHPAQHSTLSHQIFALYRLHPRGRSSQVCRGAAGPGLTLNVAPVKDTTYTPPGSQVPLTTPWNISFSLKVEVRGGGGGGERLLWRCDPSRGPSLVCILSVGSVSWVHCVCVCVCESLFLPTIHRGVTRNKPSPPGGRSPPPLCVPDPYCAKVWP